MPHIHTLSNQHDMTVSGYIIRQNKGEWQCLVHMHRKIDVLMQIGGHIELDTTPWQAMANELQEESGYSLAELSVLQPTARQPVIENCVVHPVPFLLNTHNVGNQHYHSDLCYGFVTEKLPVGRPDETESNDLRWYSIDDLLKLVDKGIALADVGSMYKFLLSLLPKYSLLPAITFSLDKPSQGLTYKR